MFGIGWQEFLIIAVVTVIVVGPKELPRVMAEAGRWLRKGRALAREVRRGVDSAIQEAELDDMRRRAEAAAKAAEDPEREKEADPTWNGPELPPTPVEEPEDLGPKPESRPRAAPKRRKRAAGPAKPKSAKTAGTAGKRP